MFYLIGMDMEKLLGYEAFRDFGADDVGMIIDEALKVCREAVGPTLQDADNLGCKYEDGKVTVPPSMHEAWKTLSENGWMSVPVNPEYGGQGLPLTVAGQVSEFIIGANIAIQIYAGLSVGASHLIETYGTDEDKALFCEKMYTGIWGGTMCLTEPDAGTDVGYLRSKAVPDPDAGDPRIYKIEGVKRFISGGEHDLTENIIHLVLARIEGALPGTKGISLFIVPKIWCEPGRLVGESPTMFSAAALKKKWGCTDRPLCTLNFGGKRPVPRHSSGGTPYRYGQNVSDDERSQAGHRHLVSGRGGQRIRRRPVLRSGTRPGTAVHRP